MGYALWLVPSQDEANDLHELMTLRPAQSDLPPRTRSYPDFHPHVTLATFDSLPPTFRLRDVIPQEGPVKAYFQSAKPGSTYLGAMSVHLRKTAELEHLHRNIVSKLDERGIRWKSRSFPHMSLFYVDEAPERERLQRMIRRCFSRADDGRLVLWTGIGRDSRPIRRFTGSSVWLVDCHSKDVEQWSRIDRVSLSRPRSAPAHRVNRDARGGGLQYAEAHPPTPYHQHVPANSHPPHPPFVHPYPRPAAVPIPAEFNTAHYLNATPQHYYYEAFIPTLPAIPFFNGQFMTAYPSGDYAHAHGTQWF
ncbi:hypothetical protein PENSPDRAFT_610742 [Peniophora sp. CONT]|nr:hypothetical protein PENSPDRAFT_610742 [Peniophora sp. CONT]